MIWSRRWSADPPPGTKANRGDGIVETYLGIGVWETLPEDAGTDECQSVSESF